MTATVKYICPQWLENFASSLKEMQEKSTLCDVTITTMNGQTLNAHKCVLAATCPILKSLLESPGKSTIEGSGYTLSTWNMFIEFIYTGKFDPLCEDKASFFELTSSLHLKISDTVNSSVTLQDIAFNTLTPLQGITSNSSAQQGAIFNTGASLQDVRTSGVGINTTAPLQGVTSMYDEIADDISLIGATVDDQIFSNEPDTNMFPVVSQEQTGPCVTTIVPVVQGQDLTSAINTNFASGELITDKHTIADTYVTKIEPVTQLPTPKKAPGKTKTFNQGSNDKPRRIISLATKDWKYQKNSNTYLDRDNCIIRHNVSNNYPYDGTLKCTICHKVLRSRKSLRKHHLIHANIKPYECKHCGKFFRDMPSARMHMRIHNDVRPFKCTYCDKSFRQRRHLLDHEMIHKNILAFKCSICEKSVRCRSNLWYHMKDSHSNFKQTCNICHKEFVSEPKYNSHMLSHLPNEKKKYKCTQCSYASNADSDLKRHIKKVHEKRERQYKCTICGKILNNITAHVLHRAMHRKEAGYKGKIYTCELCNTQFGYGSTLRRHMKRTHNRETMEFECEFCKSRFCTKRRLECHKKSKHSEVNAVHNDQKCRFCTKIFNGVTSRQEHEQRKHSDIIGSNPEIKFEFKCDLCGNGFATKYSLARHMILHDRKCRICEHVLSNKQKRQLHELRNHSELLQIPELKTSKTYACGECNNKFASIPALKEHWVRSHTKDTEAISHNETYLPDPLKCRFCELVLCNKTTRLKHEVSKHYALIQHPNLKAREYYTCSLCDNEYANLPALKRHMIITHKKEPTVISLKETDLPNPLKCRFCELVSCSEQERQIHEMREHSDVLEKNPEVKLDFKCDLCDKSFKLKHTLVVHMRTHTRDKPYKCDVCNLAFSQINNLERHILVHGNSNMCTMCKIIFKTTDELKEHMNTHKLPKSGDVQEEKINELTKSEILVTNEVDTDTNVNSSLEVSSMNRIGNSCTVSKSEFNTRANLEEDTDSNKIHQATGAESLQKYNETNVRFDKKCKIVNGKHKCRFCKLLLGDYYARKKHEKRKHSDILDVYPEHRCMICGKGFHQKRDMFDHMGIHINRCPSCDRKFDTLEALFFHKTQCPRKAQVGHGSIMKPSMSEMGSTNIHEKGDTHPTGESLATDNGSDKESFSTANRDVAREVIANEAKCEYKCYVCGQKFGQRQHLIEHIRNHGNQKCRFCSHMFTTLSMRKRHERRVHGNLYKCCKEYNCILCDKGFSVKLDLYEHIVSHGSPYSCPWCKSQLLSAIEFSAHVTKSCKIVDDDETIFSAQGTSDNKPRVEKSYKCRFCDESFRIFIARKQHERKKHTEAVNAVNNTEKKSPSKNKQGESEPKLNSEQKCRFCTESFKFLSARKRHERRTHGDVLGNHPEYNCDVCGNGFGVKSELYEHILTHESPYQCPWCKSQLFSKSEFSTHVARKCRAGNDGDDTPESDSPNDSDTSDDSDPPDESDVKSEPRAKYMKISGVNSTNMNKVEPKSRKVKMKTILRGLLTDDINKNKYKCRFCDVIFEKEDGRIKHEQNVHLDNSVLATYIATADEAKRVQIGSEKPNYLVFSKFQCRICGKQCLGSDDLDSHSKSHRDATSIFAQLFGQQEPGTISKVKHCETVKNSENLCVTSDTGMDDGAATQPIKWEVKESGDLEVVQSNSINDGEKIDTACGDDEVETVRTEKEHITVYDNKNESVIGDANRNETSFGDNNQHEPGISGISTKTKITTQVEKFWHCIKCNKQFTVELTKTQHFITDHPDSVYECPVCRKLYLSIYTAARHLRVAHLNFLKDMDVNDVTYTDSQRVVIKRAIHALDNRIECEYCGEHYPTIEKIKNHILEMHKELTYTCKYCDKKFCDVKNLRDHHKIAHSHETFNNTTDEIIVEEILALNGVKCRYCDEIFKTKDKRDYHLRKMHAKFTFQCTYCDKSYISSCRLYNHLVKAHGDTTWVESVEESVNDLPDKAGMENIYETRDLAGEAVYENTDQTGDDFADETVNVNTRQTGDDLADKAVNVNTAQDLADKAVNVNTGQTGDDLADKAVNVNTGQTGDDLVDKAVSEDVN